MTTRNIYVTSRLCVSEWHSTWCNGNCCAHSMQLNFSQTTIVQVNECKLKCNSTVLPTKYRLLSLCNMCYLLARSYKCALLQTCFGYEKVTCTKVYSASYWPPKWLDFFWLTVGDIDIMCCKLLYANNCNGWHFWLTFSFRILLPTSFFYFCNDQSSKLCHITFYQASTGLFPALG